jgi:hypothetical protein
MGRDGWDTAPVDDSHHELLPTRKSDHIPQHWTRYPPISRHFLFDDDSNGARSVSPSDKGALQGGSRRTASDMERVLMLLLGHLKSVDKKHEADLGPLRLSLGKMSESNAFVKLREIYHEHENDLDTVHSRLLDFHELDLPKKSCGLLKDKYQKFQTQLEALHSHLLYLHARYAAPEVSVLLEEDCQNHERHLDKLHERLLFVYEGPASWDFFDMLERPFQERRLKKIHLGLLELHKQLVRRDSLAYYPMENSALLSQGPTEENVTVPDRLNLNSKDQQALGWKSSHKPLSLSPGMETYQSVEGDIDSDSSFEPRSQLNLYPRQRTTSDQETNSGPAKLWSPLTRPPWDNVSSMSLPVGYDEQAEQQLHYEVPTHNPSSRPALETQSVAEHTEARSNTNLEGRCASFTNLGRTIRRYVTQRFWEPPLEEGRVRVRWNCVSISHFGEP